MSELRPVRALGKVLAGALLGIAGVDLLLHRIDARRDLRESGLLMLDDELGWTNRPGAVAPGTRISSLGLRSPEIPADADEREVRILATGESRVYGAGDASLDMADIWSNLLESLAEGKYPGTWRVLNGAVMGYSGTQIARRTVQLLDVVEPDLVLVFLSPSAQLVLDPSAASDLDALPSGRLIPKDLRASVPAALEELAAALHAALSDTSAIYQRYRSRSSENGRRPEELDKFVLSWAAPPPSATEMLASFRHELERMQAETSARNIELRAVLLIEPFQDSEERWEEFLARNSAFGAPPIGTPRMEPLLVLAGELERIGIRTWDLSEMVTTFGTDRGHFTCDGTHWSIAGHRQVALALAERIEAEGHHQSLVAARAASPRR